MSTVAIISCFLLFFILYHHIGYQLILRLFDRNVDEQFSDIKESDCYTPRIGILMCCFNEEKHITDKLNNLCAQFYPSDRYHIHVYFDGCTDNSYKLAEETVNKHEHQEAICKLHFSEVNRGKVYGLNFLTEKYRDQYDVLVYTDVSALLSLDTLQMVVDDLSKEDNVVTTGVYTVPENAPDNQKAYWDFQNEIKRMESEKGALIGVPGAMFAVKSNFANTLSNDVINDDFVLSMQALTQGGKSVRNPNITILEQEVDSEQIDIKRRERIGAGNWQQIKVLSALMNPKFGWTSFNFFSHKVLRGVMPLIILSLYICVLVATANHESWALFVSLALITVHTVGLFKTLFNIQVHLPIIDKVNYVMLSYSLCLLGIIKFEAGVYSKPWTKIGSNSKLFSINLVSFSKRLIDIIGALSLLILCSPLMLIAMIAIKLTSKGPIIFSQLRVGECTDEVASLFYVYKFRSMVVDAEAKSGAVWASKNDSRITPIGNFLRKTRIDELPQLWNVLKGEMSLIGPRPERPVFYGKLEASIPFFYQRTYKVKPGISGLAQVMNGYDTSIEDARSKIGWDYAYALSLSSFGNWIKMELSIVLKTILVVVGFKGQ